MMETTSLTLTVFFDDPFWVGVFERADGGRLSVCRVVFGAEPRDAEVLALVLRRWHQGTAGTGPSARSRQSGTARCGKRGPRGASRRTPRRQTRQAQRETSRPLSRQQQDVRPAVFLF